MHRGHHHHDLGHGAGGLTVRHDPQAFGPGHNHVGGPQRVAQWQAPHLALHRAEIDQATGMLVVQLGVTAAEAFVRLHPPEWEDEP